MEIAVSQRKWANLNPIAMMNEKPLSYEEYNDARRLIEPFRIYDACPVSDGGRAYIVTSTERAGDLKQKPVYIMGAGEHNPSVDVHQSDFMEGPTGAKEAGGIAFNMAGISIDDIDACQPLEESCL
jgi:acetyl-CoA acetyltransferase